MSASVQDFESEVMERNRKFVYILYRKPSESQLVSYCKISSSKSPINAKFLILNRNFFKALSVEKCH